MTNLINIIIDHSDTKYLKGISGLARLGLLKKKKNSSAFSQGDQRFVMLQLQTSKFKDDFAQRASSQDPGGTRDLME